MTFRYVCCYSLLKPNIIRRLSQFTTADAKVIERVNSLEPLELLRLVVVAAYHSFCVADAFVKAPEQTKLQPKAKTKRPTTVVRTLACVDKFETRCKTHFLIWTAKLHCCSNMSSLVIRVLFVFVYTFALLCVCLVLVILLSFFRVVLLAWHVPNVSVTSKQPIS